MYDINNTGLRCVESTLDVLKKRKKEGKKTNSFIFLQYRVKSRYVLAPSSAFYISAGFTFQKKNGCGLNTSSHTQTQTGYDRELRLAPG